MTIFEKLLVKDVMNDAACSIAENVKWDYDHLISRLRVIQTRIDENFGEVSTEDEREMLILKAKIEVYEKVFACLEKI